MEKYDRKYRNLVKESLGQGWRTILKARAQIVEHFRRNILRAHGNF
jgi:hypothetical protein